jgi:thioredoxin-related protein
MKNVLLTITGTAILAIGLWSFVSAPIADTPVMEKSTIEWLSWEEAVQRMEKEPKKMFIDVYTDWCGWCKKMDASTFVDPQVVTKMNEHFYAVKFNAEQRESVEYKDHTLQFRADAGRRGVHELAYSLLDGRMSYPSFVYLDENQNRITISPGYKTGDAMLSELGFIGGDHFKTQKFEEYRRSQGE